MNYYKPSEIIFSRDQIIFIIENLDLIETGIWPPDFKETGYTGGNKRRFGPAYFEVPCSISAEVKRRLEATGKDGKILTYQIKSGTTEFDKLEHEAQCALNFISLWDFRKRTKYSTWKANWTYYKKRKAIGINRLP